MRPPDSPDWQRSAVGWLFDLCPPDYRGYDVLRRHPVVLAVVAGHYVAGAVQATRDGLAAVRADLRSDVPADVVEATVAAYEREGARLVRTGRQVDLVQRALRGERWVPRL